MVVFKIFEFKSTYKVVIYLKKKTFLLTFILLLNKLYGVISFSLLK